MIARVSRDFCFQAGVHYENRFIINSYELLLSMDVTIDNPVEQNIALERIKYLFGNCIGDSVFVNMDNKTVIDNYAKAGMRVCTLPGDPYDQIVAAVLLRKINSITEGKMFVTEIKILSAICDDVAFYISADEDIDFWGNLKAWWNESNTNITDIKKVNKKEKVVELKKEVQDWSNVGLLWEDQSETKRPGNEIVFTSMDK